MALVAKSNRQRGQISIFFSASLVVLITIIAFVINIGLFVKAKINLQNATDAAAFAGASVQSRQLSKIGYLNWEMRNIYKEWLYKYYVIGNLNINEVGDPNSGSGAGMSFRMQADRDVIANTTAEDPYNIPAVCIHIEGSKTNICKRYAIPGLPEFGSSQLPGAEEASRAFMDALIGTKINDCVERTKLNMLVATTWTYNVLAQGSDNLIANRGPAILANRQGAWPAAVELAMRMRNLEYAMNRPAQTTPVTAATINGIIGENKLGNERIVKAYYSAFRNLGNDTDREMKDSFALTEIPPKKVKPGSRQSASYLLVPDSVGAYEKQYVDLKLMMVNLAIFYDALIPRADSAKSGACDISKVAIPVPGYPMGFYKNPELLTYYAVKGEANFAGLFSPFGVDNTIKLTAYSAAKPFGGRIGPMIYYQRNNTEYFVGRQDAGKYRSVPYITSYDFVGTQKKGEGGTLELGQYTSGAPLPVNFAGKFFWLKDPNSALGGIIQGGQDVMFGVPNLVYDYETPFRSDGYTVGNAKINIIRTADPKDSDKAIGLFSRNQFKKFRGDFNTGQPITQDMLEDQISRVRAPTLYESANYLVPTSVELNQNENVDSFGFISATSRPPKSGMGGLKEYPALIYAPLVSSSNNQADVMWNNPRDVTRTVFDFIRAQESGITKYKQALNLGAYAIYNMAGKVAAEAANSASKYRQAASGVSDIDFTLPDTADQNPGSCRSLAGTFLYFFYAKVDPGIVKNPALCPQSLGENMEAYFAGSGNDPNFSPTHYKFNYSYYEPNFTGAPARRLSMFSAYMPGSFTGVSEDANFTSPLAGARLAPEVLRRNFYSTKFVTLDSLQPGRGGPQNYSESQGTKFAIFSEGQAVNSQQGSEISQDQFMNTLDPTQVNADLSTVRY